MLSFIILAFIFIAISALIFLGLQFLSKKNDPTLKRIQQIQGFANLTGTGDEGAKKKKKDQKKGKLDFEKLTISLANLSRQGESGYSKVKTKLMKAGYYQDKYVNIFMGMKHFLALSLFLLYIFMGSLGRGSMLTTILLSVIFALVGYFIPNLFLFMRIQRRQEEIASGLADVLDFLVICVEAGLGLNAALMRVGKELRLRCKELSEELLMVNKEMAAGVQRDQALKNLGERTNVKDVRILASAIIMSDRLGTNIADTLRVQSDSLRVRIRQKVEEQAAKAGLKMLFPLVLFILPALFIVIMGPAIINFMEVVVPVIQK
ncbi:MAG: type II secretion system F family protein [Planctomycetota bacterium]|jgi:tight adherence protein C